MHFYQIKQSGDMQIKFLEKVDENSLFLENEPISSIVKNCPSKEYLIPFFEVSSLLTKYFIVSLEMKNILESFQPALLSHPCAVQCENGKGAGYYIIRPPKINCVHTDTVMRASDVKKLVIDLTKIGSEKVFTVGGILAQYLICDLDVLETLLYNKVYPIVFNKVQVNDEE